MNKETTTSGLIGAVIGFILGLLIMPIMPIIPTWNGGMTNYRNSMMNQGGFIDSHFIEQMIPHHEDAILMANVALEKATHQEIKKLAQDIQKTQNQEIEQMRAWYADWFGEDVPETFSGIGHGMGSGMMNMGMMGDATDMNALQTASDFDKAFITQMIPHHQMAVMMAQMLESATDRPAMKQLAKNIIEAQTREINSMRDWYQQWYGQ